MIRRPPRSTHCISSAASDVYKRQDKNSGYPISELDRVSRNFDSRVFATRTSTAWHRVIHKDLDPEILRPYLGYRPLKIIKKTIQATTQLAKMIIRYPMRRHMKSRTPHLNVHRLGEVVSTDTMFSNCRSIYDNYTCAQVFFGLTTHIINIYGMKTKGQFPDAYRDFIRDNGSPSILRRDNAVSYTHLTLPTICSV